MRLGPAAGVEIARAVVGRFGGRSIRQPASPVLALPDRPGQPLRGGRGTAATGQTGWSPRRRMTSPEAGLGVNSVDLRGMRAPAAATAATAATGVGLSRTANPCA